MKSNNKILFELVKFVKEQRELNETQKKINEAQKKLNENVEGRLKLHYDLLTKVNETLIDVKKIQQTMAKTQQMLIEWLKDHEVRIRMLER